MVRMGSPVRVRLRAFSAVRRGHTGGMTKAAKTVRVGPKGEVYYAQARRVAEERSRAAVDAIRQAVVAELPDQALILAAASIKSQHTIAYPDCFAVATAERHLEPVLTGDPGLLELGRPELEVIDVRPAT